jgi:uncharacterized membrane protein YbaN (DUF454 family)
LLLNDNFKISYGTIIILEKECIWDIYLKNSCHRNTFTETKTPYLYLSRSGNSELNYTPNYDVWCMTKQNLLIACMQSFTIWHAISKTIISQHHLPMEFSSLPGMACDIFAIFLQCKFLNSSTCTKQSRHKMWVKTLRMDCSPWIHKNKSYCWTCQSLWMLIASCSSLTGTALPTCVFFSTYQWLYFAAKHLYNQMVESEALTPHMKDFSHYGKIETSVKIERQHQMIFIWGPWCWRPPDSTPSMFPPR